ncbi:T9SS type A sorting domain-containing protein [candidate division KSB1 bacterium]|nr:T9SS type A sorting domain-containing protein [candidate division KSB1 bacterium]
MKLPKINHAKNRFMMFKCFIIVLFITFLIPISYSKNADDSNLLDNRKNQLKLNSPLTEGQYYITTASGKKQLVVVQRIQVIDKLNSSDEDTLTTARAQLEHDNFYIESQGILQPEGMESTGITLPAIQCQSLPTTTGDVQTRIVDSGEIPTDTKLESNAVQDQQNQKINEISTLPDLAVYQFSWKSATVTEGEAFWIKAQIYNAGTMTAGTSHARSYLSIDNDFDISDDHSLGRQTVGSLAYNYYEVHEWNFTFPDLAYGNYAVWVITVVDCDNEVIESNENNVWKANNNFSAQSPSGLPDLQAPTFAWKANNIKEGEDFWITARILNAGTATAPLSHARSYLSVDNDWDTSDDYPLQRQTVSSLLVNYYEDHTWNFSFPDIGTGTYSVWVITHVDCDNEITELDEKNVYKTTNSFSASDPIGLADLQIPYFSYKWTAVTEGDPFWIQLKVYNGGPGNAATSHVRAYLSTDNDWNVSNDYSLGKKTVSALTAGSFEIKQWDFNFPDLKSGDYTVWMVGVVDCDNEVTETDESNTWKSEGGFLAQSPTGTPDLQAPYFSWKSKTVSEGEAFWLKVQVNNAGTAQANSSHIRAYLSPGDDWKTSDDFDLGRKSVPALAVGKSTEIQWDFTFPDIGTGSYFVWMLALVDCDQEVTESDETNLWKCNSNFTAMDVGSQQPNIFVYPNELNIYKKTNGNLSESTDKLSTEIMNLDSDQNQYHSTGLVVPEEVIEYWKNAKPLNYYYGQTLPKSIDWSFRDSPVKDQQQCGGCWAFSSIGLIENIGNFKDLCEQVIIACTKEANKSSGCKGGWMAVAMEYINKNGVPPEDCYPFTSTNGVCNNQCTNPKYLVKIKKFDQMPGRWGEPAKLNDLKTVLQDGPITVGMRVPPDGSFNRYTGGIYHYRGAKFEMTGPSHAVLLVGYDDDQRCFKVKNSWGTRWGDGGYFYISYDDVTGYVKFGSYATGASDVYIEGDYSQDIITIENTGKSVLTVTNIKSDRSWLSANPGSISSIPAGQKQTVNVNVTNWSAVATPKQSWTITISSNDPDQANITVKGMAYHTTHAVGIETIITSDLPKQFKLHQNYPNPFNNKTLIRFDLSEASDISLKIYDLSGGEIRRLHSATLPAGTHELHWDGKDNNGNDVASGLYIYQLNAGNLSYSRKMLFSK